MTLRTLCTNPLVPDPPARSALGSTSGGAGSPNGLTEGVLQVEWYAPPVFTVSVGVAKLATRRSRDNVVC